MIEEVDGRKTPKFRLSMINDEGSRPLYTVGFSCIKPSENKDTTIEYAYEYTSSAIDGTITDKNITPIENEEKTELITEDEAINIALADRGITLEDLHETDFGMIGKPRKTDIQLVNLDDGTPAYIVTVCYLDDDPERTYTVDYYCTYTISAADVTIIDKNIEGTV